jgi:hypothetical protein
VLLKLVQNALCIIEIRVKGLIYIIIGYEISSYPSMTCCDLPRPSHSPLLPYLGRNPRHCPRPSCRCLQSLLLRCQRPHST